MRPGTFAVREYFPSGRMIFPAVAASIIALAVYQARPAEMTSVEIHVFFADREPAGPYRVTVPAHRTAHVRFDKLDDPEPIPRATEYASTFDSDLPVVVQHTRLDSRQSENALMTTIAFGSD
jgi:hypothetical protein